MESIRVICSEAATGGTQEKVVMVNDVRRAFFYAKALRPVWVELPQEDYDEKDEQEDNVGLLEMSLYGTRDAARNWSNTVEEHLKKIGFEQGKPLVLHCEEDNMKNAIDTLIDKAEKNIKRHKAKAQSRGHEKISEFV